MTLTSSRPAAPRNLQSKGLFCMFALIASVTVHGQSSYIWDGGSLTTSRWGDAANWVGDQTVTFGIGSSFTFYAPGAARLQNYIHAARTIGTMNFTADADSDVSIWLRAEDTSNARVLTFDVSTGDAAINVDSGAQGNFTVGVAAGSMLLNDNLQINHDGSGNLALDRVIADDNNTRSITKNGVGTLTIVPNNNNQPNTFGGGFILNEGRVRIGANALGDAGTLTLKGGALSTAGAGNRNVNLNYVLGGNVTLGNAVDTGNLTFTGSGDLGSTTRTLTVESYVSLNGPITGAGGITKEGSAQLRLAGINDYAGPTTVNMGRLTVDGDNSAALGSVNVNSGGVLGGNGTIGGAVTINVGGTLAPGGSPGLLTINNDLTFADGSFFDWEFAGDSLAVRGVDFDAVNLAGNSALSIGQGVVFRIIGAGQDYSAAAWQMERLFPAVDLGLGDITGSFNIDASSAGAYASFGSWVLETQGNDLFVKWSVIPEPSGLGFLLIASASLLIGRRPRAGASVRASGSAHRTPMFWIVPICLLALHAPATTNTWTGSGGNYNWSNPANWDMGAPADGVDVRFSSAGGVVSSATMNNLVDGSMALNSLWYRASNIWQVTEIPSGRSLSVTGVLAGYSLFAGYSGPGNSANNYSFAAVRGQGQLSVNNPGGLITVRVGIGTTGAARAAHLDLSALDVFTADVSRVLVGAEGDKGANNNRPGGVVYLAKTNLIRGYSTAPVLLIGDGGGDQGGGTNSFVNMGDTNVFLFDSGITVGGRRNRGNLRFWSTASPVAFFRDLAGTGRQGVWAIGDNNTGADSTVSAGTNDFSSGVVDALVDAIIVGRGQTGSTGSANGSGAGALKIGAGRVDANSLDIGFQRPGGSAAIGTVITSGGDVTNLIVNGNVRLGNYDGLAAAAATVGNLNIGSTVIIKGDIISGGSSLNSVNVTNGTLVAGGIGNDNGGNDVPLPNLNLENSTLTLDLGTAANPTLPVCTVNNLYANNVVLNVAGAGLSQGVIPLIKVNGATPEFTGITRGSLPPKVVGTFSNSTDVLYLVINGVDTPRWNGNISADWDINATPNWIANYSGTSTKYEEFSPPGDPVLFNDLATGSTVVDLKAILSPSVVTVDNSLKDYTFTGVGGLSGPAGLNKTGSRTLLLANGGKNDFSGSVAVGGGKLQLGAADRLPATARVTLADTAGAILDLNGFNQQLGALSGGGTVGGTVTLGTGTLTLGGLDGEFGGVISGAGELVKTLEGTQTISGANTYSGGTEINGGTLVVANASGSGLGSGSISVGGGTLQIGNGGTEGSFSQSVINNNGLVAINRSDDLVFDKFMSGSGGFVKMGVANTVTMSTANSHTGTSYINGGALRITHPGALGTATALLHIATTKPAQLELLNNINVVNPIEIVCKQAAGQDYRPAILNVADTNIVSGPLTGLAGGTDFTFQSDAGKLIIAGTFANTSVNKTNRIRLRGAAQGEWNSPINDGPAELANALQIYKMDSGTWILGGVNEYKGATMIEQGNLVVNGAILNSAYVTMANSIGSGALGVLSGNGYIACPVTNGNYGVLAPGFPIGALTISNALVLQPTYSTSEFEVGAGGYDQVRGMSEVTFGGTLNVTVVGTLAGTEVFKLFEAAVYRGAFDNVILPPLPSPLGWDQSQLTSQGILRVTGGISLTAGWSGSNMRLSGTGPASAGYRVFATSDPSKPLNLWSNIGGGTFGADGSFGFTDPNTSSFSRRFYRVVSP